MGSVDKAADGPAKGEEAGGGEGEAGVLEVEESRDGALKLWNQLLAEGKDPNEDPMSAGLHGSAQRQRGQGVASGLSCA